MEPERPDVPSPEVSARTELRALARLRDRIEAAVQEIERLREDNAALAARVVALQEQAPPSGDGAHALLLPEDEDTVALKSRIQSFIDTLDRLLATPEDSPRSADTSRSLDA
jgi:hypothetical protein